MNSYTSENALMNLKQKCGDDSMCTIKRSCESHLYWNKQFHKNLLYFTIYAVFETDIEFKNSNVGNKTTNIYKQSGAEWLSYPI